jgi:hypothetical protein
MTLSRDGLGWLRRFIAPAGLLEEHEQCDKTGNDFHVAHLFQLPRLDQFEDEGDFIIRWPWAILHVSLINEEFIQFPEAGILSKDELRFAFVIDGEMNCSSAGFRRQNHARVRSVSELLP